MTENQFNAIKVWYEEWSKIPRYLASAGLAFLAFSLTDLLPQSIGGHSDTGYLEAAWSFLSLSCLLASIAIIAAYSAFDLASRIYLAEILKASGMATPKLETKWVSTLGKVSYRTSALALILLLAGAGCLIFYTSTAIG